MARLVWILGFWALLGATLAPASAYAHEKGHITPIAARVVAVEENGQSYRVTLEIEALEHAATLTRVVAPETAMISDNPPAQLTEGVPVLHSVAVAFAGEVPPLFTLLLEFEDGQVGPVLVIPDFVSN